MVTRFRRMLAKLPAMIEPRPLETDAERMAWLQDNLHKFNFRPNEDIDRGVAPYIVSFITSDDRMSKAFPVASLREAIERLRRDPNYRR